MEELTMWELWRLQGPFGKLLYLYVGGIFLAAFFKAVRRLRKGDAQQWLEWSDWLQRATISVLMVAASYTLWYSSKILSGETITDETRASLLSLTLRQGMIHLKSVSVAAGVNALLFFVAWFAGSRAKARLGS